MVPFRHIFKDHFLDLLECDKCHLRSVWPRPTDLEITEMYADDYFTGADNNTHHMNVAYVDILNGGGLLTTMFGLAGDRIHVEALK